MLRRLAVVLLLSLVALPAPRAQANCGSEYNCPLEQPDTHLDSRLLFDVSQLYIDQNQAMIGSDDAFVGAVPGHHDEVRTVNRVTNFRSTFRPSAGWIFGANLPYIHRSHEHIHHHMGEDHYERWNDRGLGDLELSAVRAMGAASGTKFRVGLGVKTPTGKQDPALSEGSSDEIEPSARLGTGSWDLLASLGAEWSFHAPGKGPDERMPLRVTVAGRYNGRGVEEFRHGSEAQVNVGTEYPVVKHLSLLLQGNYRLRAKDDVGESEEVEENTGGVAIYATPGLRFDAVRGFSVYGLVQIPVYERVNGIQVVAESNLVLGVSRSIY